MRRRRRPLVPILVVLLPVLLVAGIWLGGHPSYLPGFARDTLVADEDAQVYEEAMDLIQRDYYRGVDRDQLLNKSLGAAVKSLNDQFSNYFSPKDYSSFQEVTQGQFEGVGMTVEEAKRGLRITTVYDGSPAAAGGLKKGDLITEVNGRSIAGSSSEASTARIKGPAGTKVRLTVLSGDKEREVDLKRAQVDIPVVESDMQKAGGEKIAHVRLTGFTSGAHGEVGAAVKKLLRQGADGVVLDLRDNGGGLLNEAVLVSSIFIPEGKIVSTKGRSRPERVYDAAGRRDRHEDPGRGAGQPQLGVGERDRHRRAAGPQARDRGRHPHVRQGRLPGGRAALQRRRARHHRRRVLPAQRAQHRRRRRQEGRRHQARRRGPGRPEDQARRGAAAGREDRRRQVSEPPHGGPVVAVLERRGRFLTAVPFFARGRRMSVDKSRSGRDGDLVLVVAHLAARPATARSCGASGARTWRAT